LLDAFLQCVAARYARLRAGEDPLPEWRERLAWIRQRVQIHTPTEFITGIAVTADESGSLVLRLPDGRLRTFSVGDVSLRACQTKR
jgi:biotin-(acetyl-CoA carboxylase) ligase